MMTPDEQIERIRAYIRKNKRTVVAAQAGLSRDALRNFEEPNWSPRWDTVAAVLRVMSSDDQDAAAAA